MEEAGSQQRKKGRKDMNLSVNQMQLAFSTLVVAWVTLFLPSYKWEWKGPSGIFLHLGTRKNKGRVHGINQIPFGVLIRPYKTTRITNPDFLLSNDRGNKTGSSQTVEDPLVGCCLFLKGPMAGDKAGTCLSFEHLVAAILKHNPKKMRKKETRASFLAQQYLESIRICISNQLWTATFSLMSTVHVPSSLPSPSHTTINWG